MIAIDVNFEVNPLLSYEASTPRTKRKRFIFRYRGPAQCLLAVITYRAEVLARGELPRLENRCV